MSMNSLNLILLIGRLGRDPEMGFPPEGGEAMARFDLATDRFTRPGPEPVTDWHTVVCRGRQAEFTVRYLTKGRLVFVRGALVYRTSETRDGRKIRSPEVIASEVRALDHVRPPRGDVPPADGQGGALDAATDPADDELPF